MSKESLFPTDAQYLEYALWMAQAIDCTVEEALESLLEVSHGVIEAMELTPGDDVEIEFVLMVLNDPNEVVH